MRRSFYASPGEGKYLYEGADMDYPRHKGRLMTDDFKLTDRAKKWISAIQDRYITEIPDEAGELDEKMSDLTGFKLV
ncbi:MAG: hypothetical protein U5K69_26370 [Balneolaceae bacterium]|nr:hypothetical protein [Balneolaceae bacterium]